MDEASDVHTPTDDTTPIPGVSIRVEFREVDSDDLIIVTHMVASNLPETFDHPTTLDLGIGLWEVARAHPVARVDFERQGGVTLWLRRLADAEPDAGDEQLFAPPTVQRALPAFSELEPSDDALFLYEEDWRQNEIVGGAHAASVELELDQVAATRPGTTYSRRALARPLGVGAPSLNELCAALDGALFDGVALCSGDRERVVVGGFGVETARGTVVYGIAREGIVRELAVHTWEGADPLLEDLIALGELLGAHDHLFVSWSSASMTALAECASILDVLVAD